MDKREMIERALGPFYKAHFLEEGGGLIACDSPVGPKLDFDALADQAIVIEAKISHETYPSEHTAIDLLCPTGHQGIPGKALAIIISLEEGKVAKPNDSY